MADFVQQSRADLPANLRFVGADSLDVSLVKKNPIWRTGEKDALLRARDAVKQAQQQSFPLLVLWRQVLHDNGHVGELVMKRLGQVVHRLLNESLELASLHLIRIVTELAPQLPQRDGCNETGEKP